jgi:hypothetical protein
VNVCGLFAVSGPVPRLAADWPALLRGPADSVLRRRLEEAEFDAETFCAVSGLNLRPQRGEGVQECRIGDALSMIPPVTGNGMSMALESAAWAAEPLAAYSRGERTWEEARRAVARRCDAGFARRLRWARWLQWALLRSGCREALLAAGARCQWLWHAGFRATR